VTVVRQVDVLAGPAPFEDHAPGGAVGDTQISGQSLDGTRMGLGVAQVEEDEPRAKGVAESLDLRDGPALGQPRKPFLGRGLAGQGGQRCPDLLGGGHEGIPRPSIRRRLGSAM